MKKFTSEQLPHDCGLGVVCKREILARDLLGINAISLAELCQLTKYCFIRHLEIDFFYQEQWHTTGCTPVQHAGLVSKA